MKISTLGLQFIERHEGVVLKAYRCPAGIWTIGAGLTAASGVIKPKPGMTITAAAARMALEEAINRNYRPRVEKAMPTAVQSECDMGISFDCNTGAIHRASWVKAWNAGRGQIVKGYWEDVRARLFQWRKGDGRVLPGLVRRRAEEFELLRYGRYTGGGAGKAEHENYLRWGLPVTDAEKVRVLEALRKLGYVVTGGTATVVDEIKRFQREHDLKADGIIGRATLSTLERRLAAGKKAALTTTATVGSGAASVTDVAQDAGGWAYVLPALCLIYGLVIAWKYRDAIAAKVAGRLPRVAAFLRSW